MVEKTLELLKLRPNNWFLSRRKLDSVREAWENGLEHRLPPVLVAYMDGSPGLIDGHSRAFAAYERGRTTIKALIQELEDIQGSDELYLHIHREGPAQGVESIADLAGRILEPEEYRRKWIGFCTSWLRENGGEEPSET